jgi:hypothetical protein
MTTRSAGPYRRVSAFSRRDLPEFCQNLSPPGEQRAQGRPGARCTRGLMCKFGRESAHEHTGSAETLRPSLRNGFTAYAALSPATNSFLSPSSANMVLRNPVGFVKPPLTWHQQRMPGPHGFTVRNHPSSPRGFAGLRRGSFACRRSLTGLSPARPAITCHARRRRVHRIPLQRL